MRSILILGRCGQVGSALAGLDRAGAQVTALGRADGDITTDAAVRAIERLRPAAVINAAAWTNVDGAQRERAAAFAANAEGPGRLARACAQAGSLLVHYSTDYVFDGAKQGPYVESDAPAPLNVYGESKLAGEVAIAASGARHLILRVSWVYSREGNNFFNKILARARTGAPLSVVDDQFGAPSWAHALALATRRAVEVMLRDDTPAGLKQRTGDVVPARNDGGAGNEAGHGPPPGGLYHLSAAGVCTWFEAAQAVLGVADPPVPQVPVTPVSAASFAAAAPRPRNSRLDSSRFAADFDWRLEDWHEDLARCFGKAPG